MDKFEEFQTTLAKSNEVFTTFRQEMQKVGQSGGYMDDGEGALGSAWPFP